ncbi:ribosomal maturation YjgA family protein [Paenibacillus mendelii]|uniref:ribosomal maturation YjgA family protein n=1 Tax=Paenibacillus mendelii TaxID=206163 RepID=UPI00281151FA|nr:DUF2809 domain-containing protein [Paenibacillus mendelii]
MGRSPCRFALFCLFIECSQLYQAGWINDIRATVIGALILGKGFLAVDLVRYAAGIGAAYGLDRFASILGGESKKR